MLGMVATPADLSFDDAWVVFLPNRYARRIGPTGSTPSGHARGLQRASVRSESTCTAPETLGARTVRPTAICISPRGADVLRAVSFLRDRFGARRFAVMGLCSGGYIGFHAALDDPSIQDVVLLNPQMLLWTEQETPITRAGILRRAALRPSSWKRLLMNPDARDRLAVMLPVVREAVSSDIRWRVRRLSRRKQNGSSASESPVHDWMVAAFDRLQARDCRVLFVFSEGDAGLDYLARHLGSNLDQLAERPNVSLETVLGADHTFRDPGRQAGLRNLLERHLDARGFPVPTRSRPAA